MHLKALDRWQHDHSFGQDRVRAGERRTLLVVVITAITMVVEIVAGLAFGSMALLADGLHMGSHALALGISAAAYVYARRHARDSRFSFGTGKVNSLAGFAGAVLLGGFAILMAWESIERFLDPVAIHFDQAIFVAVVGLAVNAISVVVLGGHHQGGHHHEHSHAHDHAHGDCHHQDHNLRSAYLHVMADALTSVLAIAALLSGKYLGWVWLDPVMGIVGAALITNWSQGLARSSAQVLLDRQGPEAIRAAIRERLEGDDDLRITDLHTWAIGPGSYAAIISLVACHPKSADHYKQRVPGGLGLVHVTVEVNHCPEHPAPGRT
jgi:cation diffusion facilitator family transporter